MEGGAKTSLTFNARKEISMNVTSARLISVSFYRSAGAITLLAALALSSSPAHAHHSSAMYDMDQLTTIKGVVSRLQWTNPHTYMDVDVKDKSGIIERWTVESACPAALTRNGWSQGTVKGGDLIAVSGHRAKDGRRLMRFERVMLADGRTIGLNPMSAFSDDGR